MQTRCCRRSLLAPGSVSTTLHIKNGRERTKREEGEDISLALFFFLFKVSSFFKTEGRLKKEKWFVFSLQIGDSWSALQKLQNNIYLLSDHRTKCHLYLGAECQWGGGITPSRLFAYFLTSTALCRLSSLSRAVIQLS